MRHQQSGRTLQQQRTSLSPAEVLVSAREFFARQSGIYSAFLEKEGPNWMSLRAACWGVNKRPGVSASSYMFDAQVAQFLTSLPPAATPAAVS